MKGTMSDPFSLASSAMGVISLGLTVANGLYVYVSELAIADATIKQIQSSTMSLTCLLKELEPVVEHPSLNNGQREMIATSILGCQENFVTVNKLLKPFLPAETKDKGVDDFKKSKMSHSVRKLLWPFKATETTKILAMLDQSVNRLSLALNTLQSWVALS